MNGMSQTTLIRWTLGFVAALVLLLVVLGLSSFVNKTVSSSGNGSAKPSYTPIVTPVPTNRVARSVAGWNYTVNPDLERAYAVKVAPVTPGKGTSSQDVLTISGRACNGMSARVTTSDVEGLKPHVINGTTYYITHTVSTMIACQGDLANADYKVQDEILLIFNSLSR